MSGWLDPRFAIALIPRGCLHAFPARWPSP